MQCLLQDIIIILGDVNVKVGKKILTGIAVGTCGVRDNSNVNGTYINNISGIQVRGSTFLSTL
jgi:hypothetical protein